ncbi:MAG: M1 family metallopeptidase [Chloroflexi bacterium]|nr:M1 family metallopeptidase [Chloroflexota bacterium]
MKKIIASFLSLSLLAVSCQFINLTQTPTPPPTEIPSDSWDDRSIFKGGLVPSAQPILDELPGASVYHIEFNIGSDMLHITGSEEVRYTNTEETSLNDVRFRLFPNILGGEMTVSNLTVSGEKNRPSYDLNDSLMIVPFAEPLQAGESAIVKMDFDIVVPDNVNLNYGVQAYYDDVLAFAHGYPMIAVYDDEGWNAEIPPQSGDVTYADMSFFIVKVTAPEGVTLVGSGREVNRALNGNRQTVTYEAGPVRDFYLAASPEYEVFTKESNGVTLRFYTRDFLQDGAEYALDVAARSIEVYNQRYAPYPYTELDFVSTPTLALGIEYPGMIAITEGAVVPNDTYLEATVAHEIGHQWFYNLVGNDQLDDPWLDESLTQFVTLQYFTDEYGESGNQGFRQDLEGRWAYINNAKIPVGLPVAEYTDAEYSGIVYGRGALFFEALREQIGQDAFDTFIKDYTETNAWDIATPEKLKAAAEEHCSCDLTSIFEEWIY